MSPGDVALIQQLREEINQLRQEVAALRRDLAARQPPAPTGLQDEMLALCNAARERERKELPPLQANVPLATSAQMFAATMLAAGTLDHFLNRSTPPERARAAGYPASNVSENIARGQQTAAEVVQDWLNDPPHRENVLGPRLDVGFGRAGDFWVADFGQAE